MATSKRERVVRFDSDRGGSRGGELYTPRTWTRSWRRVTSGSCRGDLEGEDRARLSLRRSSLVSSVLVSVLLGSLGCGGHSDGSRAEGIEALTSASETPVGRPTLNAVSTGTSVRLQAVSVADDGAIWASGLGGTFVRSVDGGESFVAGVVRGAESLQFRDIHAQSETHAWMLAAGAGEESRVHATRDGGVSWHEEWRNPLPAGFFDAFDFWADGEALAFSDAVEGGLPLLRRSAAGVWSLQPRGLEARENEGGFAASGTCLVVGDGGRVWIALGATGEARLLRSSDRGATWSSTDVPWSGSLASGLMSVAAASDGTLFVAGGDLENEDDRGVRVWSSDDEGATLEPASPPTFAGAVYGLATADGIRVVAVGPGGADLSEDAGETWQSLTPRAYWAVAFESVDRAWLVGPEGGLARLDWP